MNQITGVGIDVSKGFSMVAIRHLGGVIVEPPFRVNHTSRELNALVQRLHILPGEICIVMLVLDWHVSLKMCSTGLPE